MTISSPYLSFDKYGFNHLPVHLVNSNRNEILQLFLLDFNWIQSKLNKTDIFSILTDYDLVENKNLFLENEPKTIKVIHSALIQSRHILSQDGTQLAGQLLGRLDSSQGSPTWEFLNRLQKTDEAWLRPLTPRLISSNFLQSTFQDPKGAIRSMALLNDGQTIVSTSDGNTRIEIHAFASASSDNTIRFWNINTGEIKHTISINSITSLATIPGTEILLCGSSDGVVTVLDLVNRHVVQELRGHTEEIRAIRVDSGTGKIVSASSDHTIRVWDRVVGTSVPLLGHTSVVNCVAFTPEGDRLLSGSLDKTIRIWNLSNGTCEKILSTQDEGGAESLCVTPSGHELIAGFNDGTIRIWNISSGLHISTWLAHNGAVKVIKYHLDQQYIISGSADHTIKIWDLQNKKEIYVLDGHSGNVIDLEILPDGKIISGSYDGTMKIWDLSLTQSYIAQGERHIGRVHALQPTESGQVISGGEDGHLKIWSTNKFEVVKEFSAHKEEVWMLKAVPQNSQVISASRDHTIGVLNLKDEPEITVSKSHHNWVYSIDISSDGKYLVSSSFDKTVKIWDLRTGNLLSILNEHVTEVTKAILSPNGKILVSGSFDGEIIIWDARSYQPKFKFKGHEGKISDLKITSDNKYLISGSHDHKIKVWSINDGEEKFALSEHTDWISQIVLSPDGQTFVSASSDSSIILWSIGKGKKLFAFKGHTGQVNSIAISSDGTKLLSASYDFSVRVWDLISLKTLAVFTTNSIVWSCAITENNIFVAGDALGYVHFLRLEGSDRDSRSKQSN
jgi:WD40 repeat protein